MVYGEIESFRGQIQPFVLQEEEEEDLLCTYFKDITSLYKDRVKVSLGKVIRMKAALERSVHTGAEVTETNTNEPSRQRPPPTKYGRPKTK